MDAPSHDNPRSEVVRDDDHRAEEEEDQQQERAGQKKAEPRTQKEREPEQEQDPSPSPERRGDDAQPRRQEPRKKSRGGRGRFLLFLLAGLVHAQEYPSKLSLCLTVLLIFGFVSRLRRNRERKETSQALEVGARTVQIVRPGKSPPIFDFSLPGSAEPLQQATLYARTNGYVKERFVDIGDRVKVGQLLAKLDAPDIDAQLRQSQATLEQQKAALALASVNFERQKMLLIQKVVSRQEYDQNEATYNQAVANVKAAEANVANLQAQQSFQEIRAPFDGVVTTRFIDIGALIAIGTNNSAPSLFTVAQTDTLRVFINVPQAYSTTLKPEQDVEITAAEYPKEIFHGKVTRTADALDPTARTERVEIQLPSENGRLLPGMYLSVRFKVAQAEPALIVPANTVVIRKEGPRVATVKAENEKEKKIAYKPVELGRDFGSTIEIVRGLDGGEQLVVNPTDDLLDGEPVQAQEKKEEGQKPGGGQQQQQQKPGESKNKKEDKKK